MSSDQPQAPKVWDRLADATQQSAKLLLSIVTLGHVHAEDIVALTPHFARIEQLVLDIPPRDPLSHHRAEFNRAVDAATADWVLLIREREVIDEALAREIAEAAMAAKARGFRIRAIPFYAGKPLRIGIDEGEVRLFHRRYYMRYADKGQWSELMIQGTVVRLAHAFRSMTFATYDEHHAALAKSGTRRSAIARVVTFLRYLAGTRVHDANTLRYLWIEAGFRS